MTNLMDTFEKKQIEKLLANKRIPYFRSGDTLKVTLKIIEGDKSRLQAFEGMCIARKNNSVNSNFTVRKMSHGEGVEKVFPLFSPMIEKIEVLRKGDVRRAKLYYLRDRTGKRARIADRDRGDEQDQFDFIEDNSQKDLLDTEKKNTEDNKETETLVIEKIKEKPKIKPEAVEEKVSDDNAGKKNAMEEAATNEAEKKSDAQQS